MTLTNPNHPPVYDQSPGTNNILPSIKITFFIKKIEHMSHEEFYKHWQTVHKDLTFAVREWQDKVLRYVQSCQPPELKELAFGLRGGRLLDYDGCAEIWVRNWDDWLEIYNSKEFRGVLKEDNAKFLEPDLPFMVTYDNLLIGDTSKIIGGKDAFPFGKGEER